MNGWRGGASRAGVAMLSMVFMGACSGDPGKHTSGAQAPSPKPISIPEYSTTLRAAVDPLDTALNGLAGTKAYKGLDARVTAVQEATFQAAGRLSQITPPAELAAEHPRLVAALQRFHDELSDLSTQVGDRDLCTASVVRARLDDMGETANIRDVVAAVYTKLPGDRLSLPLLSTGQKGGSRPQNGTFIHSGSRSGRGTLTIDNGGSHDAVVTLSRKGTSAVSVYVRKGRKYTVRGVTDGKYTIFFTGGAGWDNAARAFGSGCTFERFEDPMSFRTERTAAQIRWTTWSITLQPTADGTARTAEVDPDDFPDG